MDVFDFDNVKTEKANAMLRYNLLQTIKRLFRFVELFLGLVLLSWTSSHLPFAVKISGEYFRQLVSIIFSPFSIFIISNVIVLTLLFKSGQSPINEEKTNLYEEFIVQSVSETILEVNTVENSNFDVKGIDETEEGFTRTCWSSQTDNLTSHDLSLDKNLSSSEKLWRLEAEKTRKEDEDVDEDEAVCIIDELSNEEFQRAIEAFIAKQVKFHQQEKLAIVPHSQA